MDLPKLALSKRLEWLLSGLGLLLLVGLLIWIWQAKPKVPKSSQTATNKSVASSNYRISVGPKPSAPIKVPKGYVIHVFAHGLSQARDLQLSPDGTLLVSDYATGKVYALPDRNHDGVADSKKTVASGVGAHGLAFYGGFLYLANTQSVVRYHWNEVKLSATSPRVLFGLPTNSDHSRRTLLIDHSGHLFTSVGSTCNVCYDSSPSATIMESDSAGGHLHVYASGLRNASFMAFAPSGQLWSTEMGRDNLGDNLPPDEIDHIEAGHNYGWPFCYGNKVHDSNFDPAGTHGCSSTSAPLFQIPAHSAPLGLAFVNSTQFNAWQNNLLVAYHGSWNRSVPTGYKVVLMHVKNNRISSASNFITGFSNAIARPVDVTFDKVGNLYISDDRAGVVYIVQKLK